MIDASPPKSADKPLDEKPPADLKFLRWALIACQALTFAVTWPLWESRIDNPWMPHLPAIPEVIAAPLQFNWGIPLLATLVWSLVHAPSGLVLHAIFLALAIVVDQLRLQPEFVSLLILMVGTLPHRGLQVVARFHLAALWFYAGFHKLLSEGYWNSGGAEHLMRTFNMLDANSAQVLAIASAVTECMVGICWMIPPTRLAASVCALLLHFGILFSLLIQGWNVAVWPWNVGLMVAAIGFAIDWEEPGHVSAAKRREVFERDGIQCTWTDAEGHRCTERGWLELDHVRAQARGGSEAVKNLRVLCRAHNELHATLDFGADHIEQRIAEARRARDALRADRRAATNSSTATGGGTDIGADARVDRLDASTKTAR